MLSINSAESDKFTLLSTVHPLSPGHELGKFFKCLAVLKILKRAQTCGAEWGWAESPAVSSGECAGVRWEGAAAGEVAPAAPRGLQLCHPGVILSSFPSPRWGGHSQWAVCVLSPASVRGRNCRDLWGGSNAPSYNKFPLHWKLFPRISLFQSLSLWALCWLFTFKWPFVWACLVYFQYSKIHTGGSQRKNQALYPLQSGFKSAFLFWLSLLRKQG